MQQVTKATPKASILKTVQERVKARIQNKEATRQRSKF